MAGGSGSKKRRRRKQKRERKPNPATQLTDDLLVEILSRVPYKSLCRFRCVSTRWRALISHPDYGRRLPQTLAGFFHRRRASSGGYCFTNVSGTGWPLIDPSFPFLPYHEREHLKLMDSCNGLLLWRSFRNPDESLIDYLVLNPATEEWVVVPVSWCCSKVVTVRLGFDPAFSPHFYIFEIELDEDDEDDSAGEDGEDDYAGDGYVLRVRIYSSETRVWCHKESGWKTQHGWKLEITKQDDFKSVFVNGLMYVVVFRHVIGVVDVKGETWRIIKFPCSRFCKTGPIFIGLSQGRLYLTNYDDTAWCFRLTKYDCFVGDKLAIWVLEDKDSNEWTLKHRVSYKHLAGTEHSPYGIEFIVVGIHPDRNMLFFVLGHDEKTLMSYDMDSRTVHVISHLGRVRCFISDFECFLPYVPLFSESLPDAVKQ